MDGLIEGLGFQPDAVKIDFEGAALNILSWSEKLSCLRIVVAAYLFSHGGGAGHLQPFVPVVLGWKGL
jgi:hypothetical protein